MGDGLTESRGRGEDESGVVDDTEDDSIPPFPGGWLASAACMRALCRCSACVRARM